MSGLLVSGLKIGFLVLLWLFILFVGHIIKTDIYGHQASAAEIAAVKKEDERPKRSWFGRKKKQPGKLVIVAGRSAGLAVPLHGEITLGRSAECSLDIDDDYASGIHARVYQDPQSWIIEDLDSTNGTYVDGVKIASPTRITPDDVIRIGRTQLKLEV